MTPLRSDILLPVETSSRELDAKLLLALFAAEAGFRCHLGPMSRIQAPGFPPSIYISKSVRFAKPVKLMADLGHTVVAWDEEGLARFPDAVHAARIEPEALRLPRLLLAWGHSNAELWRRHPLYDGRPVIESGNPRIDLLRPELLPLHRDRADDIRDRYGRYALLNTNFAMVNHFKPGGRRTKIAAGSHDAETYSGFRDGVEDHKRKLFAAFLKALPVIAESLHPHRLIVRPHPSEDQAPWFAAAAGIDNITVIYEGSVVPWQLAANCLIHNGCTSAVEASVLHLPALAYRPIENPAYDLALPNALSENFSDLSVLCKRANELVAGTPSRDEAAPYGPILRDNIASLDGPFACERIVDALGGVTTQAAAPIQVRVAAMARYAWRKAGVALSPERKRYQDHKAQASDFDLEDIRQRAAKMGKALGRFHDVVCSETSPGLVTVANGTSLA